MAKRPRSTWIVERQLTRSHSGHVATQLRSLDDMCEDARIMVGQRSTNSSAHQMPPLRTQHVYTERHMKIVTLTLSVRRNGCEGARKTEIGWQRVEPLVTIHGNAARRVRDMRIIQVKSEVSCWTSVVSGDVAESGSPG